jgi:lipid-A-disaccharide synthase
MRLFVSAGEPSGDLHGANLIHALRRLQPEAEVLGFGGERMQAAGAKLLFPLAEYPVMGFSGIIANLPTFYRILGQARKEFQTNRPDAVVLIDYPGFHWWLAGCARKYGIPVCYLMPPQLWAWGQGRVKKLRRLTNLVLSGLPFEVDWLKQHGVEQARYIGHPYFDELAEQRLDSIFIAKERRRAGPIIGILPGSRRIELKQNLASQLAAAQQIHQRRGDVRFLVACLKEEHAETARAILPKNVPIEVHVGKTPEIIHLAHSCLCVSGSVSLELLGRGKPAVIQYRLTRLQSLAWGTIVRVKHITLVNLLADRRLYPEFVGHECPAKAMAEQVLTWLQDRAKYEELCGELARLREKVGASGACGRAASLIAQLAETSEAA